MSGKKCRHISPPRWLRPDRSKRQRTPNPSTADLATAESEHEDTGQLLPAMSDVKMASDPNASQRLPFSSALSPLHQESEDGLLANTAKVTWPILKRVLKTVKEASDGIPPLKIALAGLLEVLEQCEMTADVQDDLSDITQKLAALQLVAKRHQDPTRPLEGHAEERLHSLSGWIGSVTKSIEAQTSRSRFRRVFTAPEDSKNVTELLRSLTWAIDLFALDTNLETEAKLNKMDEKLDSLEDSAFLAQLNHVKAANYISQRGDLCLYGTRCSVIASIMGWCTDSSGPRVYWLSGMAGTGKSAIARTICDNLLKASPGRLLGGSFFCSRRATAGEQDIQRIIPTLAWQLALLNKSYKAKLVERLKKGLDIVDATVERQLEELIIKPCQQSYFLKPLVVVIDALDEGSRVDDTAELLQAILKQTTKADMPLKFFVTGRPESHIRSRFIDLSHASEHATFHLQNIEESFVRADIRLYVMDRLERIKKDPKHKLPAEWPLEEETERLVIRADKLFIYAFTACNYIQRDPYDSLNRVIEAAGRDDQPLATKMDEMYMLILDQATDRKMSPRTSLRPFANA